MIAVRGELVELLKPFDRLRANGCIINLHCVSYKAEQAKSFSLILRRMKPIDINLLNKVKRRNFIHHGEQKFGRYGFLLLSLLFMIALRPFFDVLPGTGLLADILFTFALMSGVYSLSKNPMSWRIASLLTTLIIVLRIIRLYGQFQCLDQLHFLLGLLFFLLILGVILRHLFTASEVTTDVIIGSACAFVLFGIVWAYIYYLLELVHPDSFKAPNYASNDHLWDFIYYSFVTLTTLGYGDMLAITNQARGLSVLEAIVGQLYLAIMVARLVGMHSQNGSSKNPHQSRH